MPTSKQLAKKLIDRICVLPAQDPTLYGTEMAQVVRQEFARCLDAAKSDEHAQRAVDAMMAGCKFRPSPAEFRIILGEKLEVAEMVHFDPKCPECKGTGSAVRYVGDPECARCGGTGSRTIQAADGPFTAKCSCSQVWAERCKCAAVTA